MGGQKHGAYVHSVLAVGEQDDRPRGGEVRRAQGLEDERRRERPERNLGQRPRRDSPQTAQGPAYPGEKKRTQKDGKHEGTVRSIESDVTPSGGYNA